MCIGFMFFLQHGYTRTISIESIDIPDEFIYRFDTTTSQIKENNDTINIPNGYDTTIFCKDDVCVSFNEYERKPFIELPDKNGYIHRYILEPYRLLYEYGLSTQLNNNETVHASLECKTDSQCFTDKCLNNTCERNPEANIGRCDFIHTHPHLFFPSRTYVHCGKMLGDPCKKSLECSFKICGGKCMRDDYMPSDSDQLTVVLQKLGLEAAIIIFLITVCCCCCCYSKYNKKQKQKNKPNIK